LPTERQNLPFHRIVNVFLSDFKVLRLFFAKEKLARSAAAWYRYGDTADHTGGLLFEVILMHIRSAELRDAERLLEIYTYYVENTAISFELAPPSAGEFRGRIRETLKRYPYLVLEDEGTVLGYTYASPISDRGAYRYACELSIYVDRGARKRGYGRALYDALTEQLRDMGVRNVYAVVADPVEEDEYLTRNSEQFHTHMGFTRVAKLNLCGNKFGRWYNVLWLEKLIGPHD